MDIQLPVLDGYEATRQIKADPELQAIPIVVVTSYALCGDEAKAREAVRWMGSEALQPTSVIGKDKDLPTQQLSKIRWFPRAIGEAASVEMNPSLPPQ
jgi:CheY-like chemotaxis protein